MYEAIMLDYSLNSLIPYLSEETLENHYQIYLSNLDKLNQLLDSVSYDYSYSLKDLIEHIDSIDLNVRGEILYYLSSVLNHTLYFSNISNQKKNFPVKKIESDIVKYYGSYDNFKKEFIKSAMNLKGSGYTFLVVDSNNELKIINTSNEDSPYYYGMTPIIVLDLWEHAYYLQYQTDRLAYIQNFFEVIDFEKINRYYEKI